MCPSCSIATLIVAGLISLLAGLILFLLAKSAIENMIENRIKLKLHRWDHAGFHGMLSRIVALEKEKK